MSDSNPLTDPNGTPEDVATLYSWANLHGAKYRDFSAARAETREKVRLRAEQAAQEQLHAERAPEELRSAEAAHQDEGLAEIQARLATERQAEREAIQAAESAEAFRQAELQARSARLVEWEKQQQAARQTEQEATRRAAQLAAEEAGRMEAERAASHAAGRAAEQAQQQAADLAAKMASELQAELLQKLAAQQAAEQAAARASQQRARKMAASERVDNADESHGHAPAPFPNSQETTSYQPSEAFRPAASQRTTPSSYVAPREEAKSNPFQSNAFQSKAWVAPEPNESPNRPAWLNTGQAEIPGAPAYPASAAAVSYAPPPYAPPPSALPQAADETLQGSRDRLALRWFALRGVFDGAPAALEAIPAPVVSRTPAMAVFSLAGGVGKTSLVATLGRALSARGERVLLVDTAAFGLLPFFFGATDQRPGLLRTFNPPGISTDAPVQMVTIDPEGMTKGTDDDPSSLESLRGEIAKFARGASRIIVDLATASGATTRRIMRMSPLVLVPVIPDMNSVVSVSSIDAFFEHNSDIAGKPSLPFYVLNQFDASLPLHLDVREVLREQLGERLLPFALRRTSAMSEALAEGMTVMDYAPGTPLTEDFNTLAGWVRSLSAPATTSYRGVRWSER